MKQFRRQSMTATIAKTSKSDEDFIFLKDRRHYSLCTGSVLLDVKHIPAFREWLKAVHGEWEKRKGI